LYALLQKTFVFASGEIMNEFLMSTGYLRGAQEDCPVHAKILAHNPPRTHPFRATDYSTAWLSGREKVIVVP
jgi:hypothetical protein